MTYMAQNSMDAEADVFTDAEGLIGSVCTACGERFFPAAASCAKCSSEAVERLALGHDGRLWSWTLQRFLPKAPYRSRETADDFRPFGVGLVQLSGGLIVKSRLARDHQDWTVGQPLRLRALSLATADGDALRTFEFAPREE